MRGGAIPLFSWGTLLLVLAIGDWVWDAKPVNGATATFAVVVIYLGALVISLRAGRRAVRRGPPEYEPGVEAVPQSSMGAFLFAFGLAALVFGFTFGHFVVFFGAAMMVIGLGRAAEEVRAERVTRRQVEERAGELAAAPLRPAPPEEVR